jgi:hypothetical protein
MSEFDHDTIKKKTRNACDRRAHPAIVRSNGSAGRSPTKRLKP